MLYQDPQNEDRPSGPGHITHLNLGQPAFIRNTFQGNPKYTNDTTPTQLRLAVTSLQSCPTLCDPIHGSHQAPQSLGFYRQEHWSGLPFPSPMRESEVAQSCPTLHNPMDCSLPGSSVHGIFQARVLEWVAIAVAAALAYLTVKIGPLHCSFLENPRDGGAWWAAVFGVAQSRTRLQRLSSSSSSIKRKC